MSGFVRLLRQRLNPPAETLESFSGKTVLVTGTTSGLGLAAVKKLSLLGPSRLIITARTIEKGEAVKRQVEQHIRHHVQSTKTVVDTPEIIALPLDMSSMSDVQTFFKLLTSRLGNSHLDAAILNAGTSQKSWSESPDGYEETLQVNVISTVFLALLVLPLLMAAANTANDPSHLTVVSSGLANVIKPESVARFSTSDTPLKDMSLQENFPPGRMGGQGQYSRSKLMLEYAMRRVAASSALLDATTSRRKVVVNSVCPGLCKSDLGRQYTDSLLLKILMWVVYAIFARSAEQGANSYISALTRNDDGNGQMWKDDRYYEAGEMLSNQQGRELGDRAWEEIQNAVLKREPAVKALL